MKSCLLLVGVLMSLSSCLVIQDVTPPQDPIVCPYTDHLAQPTVVNESIHIPNLNLNPLYLELRTSWYPSSEKSSFYSFGRFRLFNTNHGTETEIMASTSGHQYRNYTCRKVITAGEFSKLTQLINQAEMCKGKPYVQDSCSLAMIAPASLYVIDTTGPVTVNLHPYSIESDISFCNNDEVENLQNTISDLFNNIQIQTDCTLIN